jgi:hypothetical protein
MFNEFKKDRKLWFKARSYGWGWTPVSWEGWLFTLVYCMLILGATLNLKQFSDPKEAIIYMLITIIPSTLLLMVICFIRGETPHWNWGKKKEENLINKDQ